MVSPTPHQWHWWHSHLTECLSFTCTFRFFFLELSSACLDGFSRHLDCIVWGQLLLQFMTNHIYFLQAFWYTIFTLNIGPKIWTNPYCYQLMNLEVVGWAANRTLIRHHLLWYLIWVYIVCSGPSVPILTFIMVGWAWYCSLSVAWHHRFSVAFWLHIQVWLVTHKFDSKHGHITFVEIDCEIFLWTLFHFHWFKKGMISYWQMYVHRVLVNCLAD